MKSAFHSLFIDIAVLLWCLLLRPHPTFKDRNQTHAGPGVKMDTLAKSPKAIPFDGRLHGNIQRFVFHSVPSGKLIIKSALWLHWSSDYRRRQASFSPLFRLMEFTRLSKWKFNWFFFPFAVSGTKLAVLVWIHWIEKESNRGKIMRMELQAPSLTLTKWLGGRILSCDIKDTIC